MTDSDGAGPQAPAATPESPEKAPADGAPTDLAKTAGDVLTAYSNFAAGAPDEKTAKAFGAHHTACKAALGHLEAIAKLARQLGLAEEPADDLRPALGAARTALRDLAEAETTDEDDAKGE